MNLSITKCCTFTRIFSHSLNYTSPIMLSYTLLFTLLFIFVLSYLRCFNIHPKWKKNEKWGKSKCIFYVFVLRYNIFHSSLSLSYSAFHLVFRFYFFSMFLIELRKPFALWPNDLFVLQLHHIRFEIQY